MPDRAKAVTWAKKKWDETDFSDENYLEFESWVRAHMAGQQLNEDMRQSQGQAISRQTGRIEELEARVKDLEKERDDLAHLRKIETNELRNRVKELEGEGDTKKRVAQYYTDFVRRYCMGCRMPNEKHNETCRMFADLLKWEWDKK